jgi:uncharacterized protein (TIGR04255 family)
MAELLPGIVFGQLPGRFKNVATLPFGNLPKQARDANPQFRYMPTSALEGPNGRLMFAEQAVSVSFVKPYAGWAKVKPLIVEFMTVVMQANLAQGTERYALKYVNVLKEGQDEFDLSQTTVNIKLGNFDLRPKGSTLIHAEIDLNGCTNAVDIVTGAKANVPGSGEEMGVAIVVDTIRNADGSDSITELPAILELLHQTEKEIFFGLLKGSTLETLGPRYPVTH